MKHTTRLLLTLPMLLIACVDQDPVDPDVVDGPQALVDEEDGFRFLSPIGKGGGGKGNLSFLSPTVLICEWNGDECGDVLARFTKTSAGPGGELLRVAGNHFQVDWNTGATPGIELNTTYKIVVELAGTIIGTADIKLKNGRSLPIKFTIGVDAIQFIQDQPDGHALVQVFTTTGGVQTAEITGEALFQVDGAHIQIPGGGTTFTLFIVEQPVDEDGRCSQTYGGPNAGRCYLFETLPAGVTFFDGDDPAGIAGVCPNEDAGEDFELAKEDDGVTTFPEPLGLDDPLACGDELESVSLRRVPRILRGLARLILPTPLYARDLGETGTIGAFSTLYWAMPLSIEEDGENPSGPFLPGETVTLSFRVENTHTGESSPELIHDVTVNFTVTGGTLSAASGVTSEGFVTVTWYLPESVGVDTLTVKVAGTDEGMLVVPAVISDEPPVERVLPGRTPAVKGFSRKRS